MSEAIVRVGKSYYPSCHRSLHSGGSLKTGNLFLLILYNSLKMQGYIFWFLVTSPLRAWQVSSSIIELILAAYRTRGEMR